MTGKKPPTGERDFGIQASALPGDSIEEAPSEEAPSEEEEIHEAEEAMEREPPRIRGNDGLLKLWQEGKLQNPPHISTNSGDIDLQEYRVERDDNLPLQFQGYLVGRNEIDIAEQPRGTQISVYVTPSNKIITAVYQWQRKEGMSRDRHKAGVHQSPESALAWLISDGGGKLGKASREAWDSACKVWESLQGHDVEVID